MFTDRLDGMSRDRKLVLFIGVVRTDWCRVEVMSSAYPVLYRNNHLVPDEFLESMRFVHDVLKFHH